MKSTLGNLYRLRTWVEYGFRQSKQELGWTNYRFTDFQEINKWWEIIFSAYWMVNSSSKVLCNLNQVESREIIISRLSLLDLYVKLSLHTAPETFSFCFCSCEYNHDKIRVLLQDCHDSSCYDFHRHGVDVLFHFL